MKPSDKKLDKKRILFFSPAFFDYENKIKSKMLEMGASVDYYDVRAVSSPRDRAILKVLPQIFNKTAQNYYEEILNHNRNKNYDYILIVKCDMTPIDILMKLKKNFPHAKLCLYLWDSVKNIPGITKKFRYFDILHSFDLEDCKKFATLEFRPLFFADEFRQVESNNNAPLYDISFCGTIHSDRYNVVKQIRKICEKYSFRFYGFCYLQSYFIYLFYKMTKQEFRNDKIENFSFVKKSSKEIGEIVNNSKIILDIQHPRQSGLTMRTIEMIGMCKKLITTNNTIKEYDFYNPDNICIIDRKNVNIDFQFMEKSYNALSPEIYEKYSLNSWILDVLDV